MSDPSAPLKQLRTVFANFPCSLIGGALMVVIGVLYLIFEDFVLADFTWPTKASTKKESHITRVLVGVQIGLAALSMIITRSSALSLQAKKGLPPGNQAIGWLVLGETISSP